VTLQASNLAEINIHVNAKGICVGESFPILYFPDIWRCFGVHTQSTGQQPSGWGA
jgi:hypothetical protein